MRGTGRGIGDIIIPPVVGFGSELQIILVIENNWSLTEVQNYVCLRMAFSLTSLGSLGDGAGLSGCGGISDSSTEVVLQGGTVRP